MAEYQHILLATDFSPESDKVIQRAKALQANNQCQLSLVHVLEPISIAYGGEFPVDLGDLHKELEKQASEKLDDLSKELGVAAPNCFLEVGITEKEIIRVAEAQNADLIVLGSHGRHGLSLLLGSTANAVLHHAKCDVLAVRVFNK